MKINGKTKQVPRRWYVRSMLTLALMLSLGACSGPDAKKADLANAAARFENKLIRRPGTSPEDGKVYIVRNGKKQWVVKADWVKTQGFKWPDDVNLISAAEVDSIPTGEPIQ